MSPAAEMMGMLMVTAVSAPLFFVHILELGHKSSYFQSTSRLDPCPLPESVSFIQQNISHTGEVSWTPKGKRCLIFLSQHLKF